MNELSILFENEDIVVVDKPAGLPCLPRSSSVQDRAALVLEDTCLGRLAELRPSVLLASSANFFVDVPSSLRSYVRLNGGLLQRLDNATSGALACAKSLSALQRYRPIIQGHRGTCAKRYLAVVHGELPAQTPSINCAIAHAASRRSGRMVCVPLQPPANIERSSSQQPKQARRSRAQHRGTPRPAQTRVLAQRYLPERNASLCLLEISRGQRHQIRCHLAELGTPILGDSLYGGRADCAGGLQLHCFSLSFSAFNTEATLQVIAPVPLRISEHFPEIFELLQ